MIEFYKLYHTQYVIWRWSFACEIRHATKQFFWEGESKNLRGNGFALGAISRKKRSLQNDELILPPNYGDDQKKGPHFGKQRYSAALEYQIKNNTKLFLSILKLKDLSEIYLEDKLKFGGAIKQNFSLPPTKVHLNP